MTPAGTCRYFEVDPKVGLSDEEVRDRQQIYGPNRLSAAETQSWGGILANQFKSLLTLILLGATLLSYMFGDTAEALAILVVVAFNALVGFLAESRAVKAMTALRQMGRATTRVRRDGKVLALHDDELVPGDIVLMEAGDVVTADIRLLDTTRLQADESLLTGESVPVDKHVILDESMLEENGHAVMVFRGTAITRGSAEGVVVATGHQTELGKIADIAESAEGSMSPLEKRLQRLSEQLLIAVLVLTVALTGLGILAGHDTLLMVKTGVALAVAAIPEGLPIVATLALARGMWRLAARNALIERLSAVETLGSVTVILTDKTGTLTENRMQVVELMAADAPSSSSLQSPSALGHQALRVCGLCYSGTNAAQLADPMESALVEAARNGGEDVVKLEQAFPRVEEHAFDPLVRMMATVHKAEDGFLYLVKGAPEAVLEAAESLDGQAITDDARAAWLGRVEAMAKGGLRVLALAEKTSEAADDDPYQRLEFLGLVGLKDPPRGDAAPAVEAAKAAGVRVVMATGDNAATGLSIAEAVGIVSDGKAHTVQGDDVVAMLEGPGRQQLLDTRVFARMNPRQKLDLIDLHQKNGAVVAMAGDGVNDAPALKKADVGIAMGVRGTEVAKQAADMILKDDAFASIVLAIQQGRVIFANIRKFVIYLLSCNLSEVLVVTLAVLGGLPLPLLPLQILFLNLVTDVFPALALGFGKGDTEILHRPPRPKSEGLLQTRHWQAIIGYALLMTASVMGVFVWALGQPGYGHAYANTVAFLTLAFGQLWHVFNMRSRKAPFFQNQVATNLLVWVAIGICLLLIALALKWEMLRAVLDLSGLDNTTWAVVLAASLAPLIIGQMGKALAVWYRARKAHD
ncbi:MAG: cation-transporting P-type ATPase [Alphaproteobacteria bacterium]|nr:cation-transporting P-type ATPase [Alphaproteobacteria bacterium]